MKLLLSLTVPLIIWYVHLALPLLKATCGSVITSGHPNGRLVGPTPRRATTTLHGSLPLPLPRLSISRAITDAVEKWWRRWERKR
uniref:Secreted protein n=1 Tax=Oryza nivara TaxID=4536 RepID=A0A0E0IQZ6_ORYNI